MPLRQTNPSEHSELLLQTPPLATLHIPSLFFPDLSHTKPELQSLVSEHFAFNFPLLSHMELLPLPNNQIIRAIITSSMIMVAQ
uniref:Uncharacterized protein n=1 Tax=Pithovirus LCPAC302 TaxID=2506593 RepID=A0A481Z8L8_9VIRU|nr:MAG: hypothetical protein LCPAC302_00790 [Pithovirus LCPAC302]